MQTNNQYLAMGANPPFLGPDGGDLASDEARKTFIERRLCIINKRDKMLYLTKAIKIIDENRW